MKTNVKIEDVTVEIKRPKFKSITKDNGVGLFLYVDDESLDILAKLVSKYDINDFNVYPNKSETIFTDTGRVIPDNIVTMTYGGNDIKNFMEDVDNIVVYKHGIFNCFKSTFTDLTYTKNFIKFR